MAGFWSIAIGLLGFFSLIAIVAEYTDARQRARYRRAQQDRVNRGVSRFHGGEQ